MKLNEDISRIKEIINEQKESCPKTLTGKKLKSKKEEIEYGPAQKCGNCVAFDISPRMKSCIGEDEEDTKTGYCWMHKINCLKENWCNTWVAGGPIEEDEESYEKQ